MGILSSILTTVPNTCLSSLSGCLILYFYIHTVFHSDYTIYIPIDNHRNSDFITKFLYILLPWRWKAARIQKACSLTSGLLVTSLWLSGHMASASFLLAMNEMVGLAEFWKAVIFKLWSIKLCLFPPGGIPWLMISPSQKLYTSILSLPCSGTSYIFTSRMHSVVHHLVAPSSQSHCFLQSSEMAKSFWTAVSCRILG